MKAKFTWSCEVLRGRKSQNLEPTEIGVARGSVSVRHLKALVSQKRTPVHTGTLGQNLRKWCAVVGRPHPGARLSGVSAESSRVQTSGQACLLGSPKVAQSQGTAAE